MTTIHEARFTIERRLLEFYAAGAAPLVAQVDAVLEGAQVFFHVYLVDDELTNGEPLMATVDLPAPLTEDAFNRRAFVEAFWAAGAPSLARN